MSLFKNPDSISATRINYFKQTHMIRNSLLTLLLICCGYHTYSQTFASTSFEDPVVVAGVQYTDTGNPATDHDLVNNPGEPPVDFVSTGGEIGFNATFIAGGSVGLTDGDYVGVTDFTGAVSTFIDGLQGYQFQDTDGTMLLTFDAVSLTGRTNPTLDMYYFVRETGWESGDSIRIWLELNGGTEIDLFNTFGQDIDNLGVEGLWTQATANLSGFTTATLKVLFASNSGSEELFLDHITFSEGGVIANCNITADYFVQDCNPLTDQFSFEFTVTDVGGSPSGFTYSVSGGTQQGPFPYDVPITLGPFPAGTLNIYGVTVADQGDPTCTDNFIVTPPPSCQIMPCASIDMVLTGVIDGDLLGGLPKAVELYVLNNISDLSTYGIGRASNGTGSSVIPDYIFPADAANAGDYIYVTTDSTEFRDFFGFNADYITSAVSINGDDAVELYCGGVVIDVFGDVNVDGTGQIWEYADGWAYRTNCTGPDDDMFDFTNWFYSSPYALDSVMTNANATIPFPIGTYSTTNCCAMNLTDANLGGGSPNNISPNTYLASNSITSTGVVDGGTMVTFDAGSIICLESGFTSETTANFAAVIGGCSPVAPLHNCDFSVDIQSSASQFHAEDGPVEVSYQITDNSTEFSSFTIYCFKKQCVTNNDIGQVFSASYTPTKGANTFSFNELFTVNESGLYRSVVYAYNACTGVQEIIDQVDFTIWYPQQFHPCE